MVAKRASKKTYPRFVRKDNDLVRVGWSEDRGGEYVIGILPKHVVEMVVSRILDVHDDGGNFSRSDFKRLIDIQHGPIPENEIGRALLWLKSAEMIRKFKRGYQVRPKVELLDEWEKRWNRIPKR